ncbi:aldo/keto reductase [Marixanthomonas sp. SCSIO 43207]|uniref:aldo/keto reductase n=1 Tax=Marixanthomonas sp. SCSIO 43207 TaxID=2779360 RepID=UPI001CA8F7D8|nr:aldo/keto reductase [Marixanthomonas sp. SCSIO 43207]UAB80543.1 aldo/keto reductase [Marixanthomonas sp. SCSIO 43207]
MNKLLLGKTIIKTSPIIFGGNVFGWTLNEKESFEMLDLISDLGINCIDTADVYSRWHDNNTGGESETIIGNWMKSRGNRKKMIICTKAGMDMGQGGVDISESHMRKSIEDSLKRLQTDYIDLFYAHKDDEKTAPEETLGVFKEYMDDRKIRYIGASNFSAERLRAFMETSRKNELPAFTVFQPEYNLIERNQYEGAIEDVCKEYRLGVVSYFSLASGLLSGKYKTEADIENSSRSSYVKKHWNQKTKDIIDAVQTIANTHKVTPAAVALTWVLHSPTVTAPIVSATKKEHLQSFREASLLELTRLEMKTLNEISS